MISLWLVSLAEYQVAMAKYQQTIDVKIAVAILLRGLHSCLNVQCVDSYKVNGHINDTLKVSHLGLKR